MIDLKFLDFNLDKSCAIVIGPRAKRKEMNEQLLDNPIKLCQKTIKVVEVEKYLGDDDCRANAVGGFEAGIDI